MVPRVVMRLNQHRDPRDLQNQRGQRFELRTAR